MKWALPIDQWARRPSRLQVGNCPAHLGQLPDRHRGTRGIHHGHARRLAPHVGHGDHVEVVVDLRHGLVALGRHHDPRDAREGDSAPGAWRPVTCRWDFSSVPSQRIDTRPSSPVIEVDAVGVGPEVREGPSIGRRHQRRRTSRRGQPHDVLGGARSRLRGRLLIGSRGTADDGETLPVGRPGRMLVDARGVRQRLGRSPPPPARGRRAPRPVTRSRRRSTLRRATRSAAPRSPPGR